ncbi:CIR protein [Plasmodium chabaudi chabaudi]|uniref:CIR protein n=1 Tax=Plasmodium chabaudi chabaudi TaxID=31271 RepID=A0A1C6WBH8_PLACU|nr:CIR protein [Plasmodium chabaudi chabaudi]
MDNLCKVINQLDRKITVKVDNSMAMIEIDKIFTEYCPNNNCDSNKQTVVSAFIMVLKYFMSIDDLENDKRAEYAILWLCYKLNPKAQNGITTLKEFYNKYLKDNTKYIEEIKGKSDNNINKDLIDNKINSMNMNIKDIPKFYEALKTLCNMYTGCNEKKENYTSCSQDAQKFANEFNKLNDDNRITGNNLYSQILYALFNDYNSFKNGCAKNCSSCNDIPTLSEIKAPPSSSITRKLIPVLLTFSIPFFLGIAYKSKAKKNKEEDESLTYDSNSSDCFRNSNND